MRNSKQVNVGRMRRNWLFSAAGHGGRTLRRTVCSAYKCGEFKSNSTQQGASEADEEREWRDRWLLQHDC